MPRILLYLVLAAFGAWSTWALVDVGYLSIWRGQFTSSGGIQVLCDLVISLSLVCVWMNRDARARGRSAWPFIVGTVFLGSFGPLLYLVLREWQPAKDGRIARQVAASVIQ